MYTSQFWLHFLWILTFHLAVLLFCILWWKQTSITLTTKKHFLWCKESAPVFIKLLKCHFSLKCWDFMKFTPTFKLKYKSKLSNVLKLRITLSLSNLRPLEKSLRRLGVASRGLWWRWGNRDVREEEEYSRNVWQRALNQTVTFPQLFKTSK